jgi:general stress protein YciG
MREHPLRVLQYEYSLEGTMRQTVVGVFETSDEARRAQAALLDAQFQPASIRVSAGGTPRGADDGVTHPMTYPSTAGIGGDFLTGPPMTAAPGEVPAATPHARPHARDNEGPLERLSDFFRDLFGPEDQQMEMERYEEAMRRGGTLVAVDVEDDLEETLASDILIRAGAYDLEERAQNWGRSDYAAEDLPASHAASTRSDPVKTRSAVMPGNVTSMDPLDPTGYVASRSDTMGSGMPGGAVVRLDEDADAMNELPPGPLDTRPFGAGLASPRQSQNDPLDPLAPRSARGSEGNWTETDGLESDRREVFPPEVFPGEAGPTEADRMEADLLEAREMGTVRVSPNGALSTRSSSMDRASRLAAREADRMSPDRTSPYPTEADRMESEQLEAARLEADRIEADRQEAARLDAARRETSSAEAAHRVAQRREAERLEAQRSRTSAATQGLPDFDGGIVSGHEADALPATDQEMFLDDAGFASGRDEAMRSAAASQRQGRSPISRNVRIYSRRADDPAARRAAAAAFEDDRMAPSTARNLPLRETDEAGRLTAAEDAERMRDFASREGGAADRVGGNFTPRADTVTRRDAAVREESLSPELMPDEWSAMSATPAATPATPSVTQERVAHFHAPGAPDAPAVPEAPADPATDMRAELGLRSPLDDQRMGRRRVLDDGAPFAPDAYDDDDRRYAAGADSEYGTETGFVDAREPHPLPDADGSEWDHIKRVVRDAWHRMTGHHH